MAQRTTLTAVQDMLGGSAPNSNWDGVTDLQQFVDIATLFVDEVVAGRSSEGVSSSTAFARSLETVMSCHFYTKLDPTYTSRSTRGASGSFNRGKEPEPYKAMAIEFDTSGWVNALLNRFVASGNWLGKPPSEQIPYSDRD